MKDIQIEHASLASLLVEQLVAGQAIGRATAFYVESDETVYLITNWHVVTGKNKETGAPCLKGGTPDSLRIWENSKIGIGNWAAFEIKLYEPDTGNPIWIEHDDTRIDVVAIPFSKNGKIEYYPVNIEESNPDVEIFPAEMVSVVGFPFGQGNSQLAIWKTGHIASEVDVNYNGLPVFLIDATTKPSMSGSPVYFRRYNFSYVEKSTRRMVHQNRITSFLGVYSGRTNELSEIGMVWKPHVILDLLAKNRVGY